MNGIEYHISEILDNNFSEISQSSFMALARELELIKDGVFNSSRISMKVNDISNNIHLVAESEDEDAVKAVIQEFDQSLLV